MNGSCLTLCVCHARHQGAKMRTPAERAPQIPARHWTGSTSASKEANLPLNSRNRSQNSERTNTFACWIYFIFPDGAFCVLFWGVFAKQNPNTNYVFHSWRLILVGDFDDNSGHQVAFCFQTGTYKSGHLVCQSIWQKHRPRIFCRIKKISFFFSLINWKQVFGSGNPLKLGSAKVDDLIQKQEKRPPLFWPLPVTFTWVGYKSSADKKKS